jgi:hypothetical protein
VGEVQLDVETAITPLDRSRVLATQALEALGEEISRNLGERLAAVENPARAEIGGLQARAAALRESYAALQPRVASKLRLLAFAIDEALAAARDDEAAEKRAEAAELEANLKNIQADADRCDALALALERKRSKDVEIAFKAAYDDARRVTVEESTALALMLDRVWDSLCQYNTGTLGVAGKINLTPNDWGTEKTAFYSLVRWFGFGGRTR